VGRRGPPTGRRDGDVLDELRENRRPERRRPAGLPAWPAFTEASPQGLLLGDEVRAGKPFDEQALARIDSAYAKVRASAARK